MSNRSLIKRILLVLLFLILPTIAAAVSLLPVGKIEYDFVYDRLEREEARSLTDYSFQLGPYDASSGLSFGPFAYLSDIPRNKLVLFSRAEEDFYSAQRQSPSGFESVRGGVAASPVERLFVYGNFVLDERKAEDEFYTGKKWRGLAGGVEEAFLYFRWRQFEITSGRFASFWGPRNSLILAPTNPLDGFEYNFHWGRLALSYRLAKLDGLSPEDDGVEQFENRFLAAHRLDIRLSGSLRLGVFESVVYGGPGRQIDLLYLNPIVFFHADQLNEGVNDNSLMGLDVMYRPRAGIRLYGQLLVDDFQVEKESQGDQEPDQYGMIAGVHFVDLRPSLDLRFEYQRVTNWAFNQLLPRNRYLLNTDLIGGASGNDYELLTAGCERWFGDDLRLSGNFAYRLQGEGRVTDDWTAPWLEAEGDYDEPFPSGVVEKTRSTWLGFKGFIKDHFFVDIEAGVHWFDNHNHTYGEDESQTFARVRISSFFSTPVKVDR